MSSPFTTGTDTAPIYPSPTITSPAPYSFLCVSYKTNFAGVTPYLYNPNLPFFPNLVCLLVQKGISTQCSYWSCCTVYLCSQWSRQRYTELACPFLEDIAKFASGASHGELDVFVVVVVVELDELTPLLAAVFCLKALKAWRVYLAVLVYSFQICSASNYNVHLWVTSGMNNHPFCPAGFQLAWLGTHREKHRGWSPHCPAAVLRQTHTHTCIPLWWICQ